MKIAYIFTEVPEIAGAFPNAELDEMAARGLSIEVFILRNRRPTTDEGHRIEGKFTVHRSPYLLSLRLIASVLGAVIRHPILVAQTVLQTIRNAAAVPMVLVKSLGILPKSIHYAAIARKRDITLIHAYWVSLPALAASVMARFSGRPFTTWAHAGADIYSKKLQTEAALIARLSEAERVFTCNSVNVDHFRRIAGGEVLDKVMLLTHGVEFHRLDQEERPEPAGEPVLLAVGRLTPQKGYDVLIKACCLLKQRGQAFACRIVGTGKSAGELQEQARSLGLSDVVHFPGHIDHSRIVDLYREATIFVMPSVLELDGSRDGLPNVLLEAMAAGVVCVGTAVASIPDVIRDGETGLLVAPGDAEALAGALVRLLDDHPLRRRLAAAGTALVRQSYDRALAMDRLYAEFLALEDRVGRGAGEGPA